MRAIKKMMDNERVSLNELKPGDHFQLKSDGIWYTVHCQVMSKNSDDGSFDRMHYTLAVSGMKMFVFDAERKVKPVDINSFREPNQ